uniref:Uncharacterized protein n=1 Tax=Plectus sambesii TaxID=2011161 RepID=A0A914X8W6_9BILA
MTTTMTTTTTTMMTVGSFVANTSSSRTPPLMEPSAAGELKKGLNSRCRVASARQPPDRRGVAGGRKCCALSNSSALQRWRVHSRPPTTPTTGLRPRKRSANASTRYKLVPLIDDSTADADATAAVAGGQNAIRSVIGAQLLSNSIA